MLSDEERKEWREEILSGVESIPKIGIPGTMVVCGNSAEPILTGSTVKDVLVAAAEMGQGRVVVFTHDSYMSWFLKGDAPENAKKFSENVLAWVTKGRYTNEWKAVRLNKKNLAGASPDETILVWKGSGSNYAALIDDLTKFVNDGGSIIIGVTPWGSIQVSRCDIEDILAYKFLRQVEIFLSDGYNHIKGSEVVVANNRAEAAHVGVLLNRCQAKEMKISELSVEIVAEIGSIPDEDCRALLAHHLTDVDVVNICKPPHPKKPVKTSEDRCAILFANLVLKKTQMMAPGVKEFPGDFDSPPPLSCVEYKIESHCNEAHPVGAYLAPGGTAIIEVVEGNATGWKVQVGCHSDNLRSCDRFKRWPDILVKKKVQSQGETKIYSPFGGSIYFFSPNGNSSLTVRVKDVVASPLFHLDDMLEDWMENRTKPGLWADLVGKHLMVSVPSSTIRELDHPQEAVEFWDTVVMVHHDLRGTKLDKKRRQWMVPDVQPSAGYMHSGYPIVTHMDAADPKERMFLVRKPKDEKDMKHWGFFHELGHNMQDGMWTFGGTGEVTCNIFTLHAMEKLFNMPPWEHPWLEGQKKRMKNYLKNGAKFEEWKKNPGVGLGIYAQLARDFGFDTYKKVFRQYESEKPKLKNDQEKIDHWIKLFSKAAESNLVPAFKLWGFPVSEQVNKDLEGLVEYTPQDEVTEVVMAAKKEENEPAEDET